MCTVCGCSSEQGATDSHDEHHHHHHHHHDEAGDAGLHHYGHGPARAHAPGLSQARMVEIEQNILGKNDEYAAANRRWLAEHPLP